VCEFFGVSIFTDELRGNLILAENEINRLNKSEKDDPDQAAALAILRATVLILQGRFDESAKTLDDLVGIEQVGPRWLFRQISYRLAYSKFPPISGLAELSTVQHFKQYPLNIRRSSSANVMR
jgi:hypothetical protein